MRIRICGTGGERGRDGIYFRIGLFRERQSRGVPDFPCPPSWRVKGESKSAELSALLEAVRKPGGVERLDEKQKQVLAKSYRSLDPEWIRLNGKLSAHEARKPVPKKIRMMVSSEGFKPMKHHADGRGYPHFYKQTHYLDRGDPNKKGEVIEQGFLPLLMRNGKSSAHWQKPLPEGIDLGEEIGLGPLVDRTPRMGPVISWPGSS